LRPIGELQALLATVSRVSTDEREKHASLLAENERLRALLGKSLDFIVAGIIAAQKGATVAPAPYALESEIRDALSRP
jgi:hypothetical protein